ATPEHQRAAVQVLAECRRELAALISGKLRRADAGGVPVEPAGTRIPAINYREAEESIDAARALAAVRRGDRSAGLSGAALQDEVGGRAHLARTEHRAWAALHDLNAVGRVVQTEQRARVHEGQVGHAVQR